MGNSSYGYFLLDLSVVAAMVTKLIKSGHNDVGSSLVYSSDLLIVAFCVGVSKYRFTAYLLYKHRI